MAAPQRGDSAAVDRRSGRRRRVSATVGPVRVVQERQHLLGRFHRSVIPLVEGLPIGLQNGEVILPALGRRNASVRQVGSVAVTLTFATGSVVNVATRLAKGALGQPSEVARASFLLTLWGSILARAATGASPLYDRYKLWALWLPSSSPVERRPTCCRNSETTCRARRVRCSEPNFGQSVMK